MKKLGFALVLMLLVAGTAFADTYVLNASGGWGSGPFGTVTVTQPVVGSGIVNIAVDVDPNKLLYGTGAHTTFTFNGTSGIVLSGSLPSGFTFDAYHSNYYTNPPFGSFDYAVDCSSDLCNQRLGGPVSFSFNVSRSGLTPGDFALLSTGGAYFAVDIYDTSNNLTGAVGAIDPPSQVPEPGSLALLGSGLLGMGGFLRRRIIG